jgi:hypothetical protein
LLQPLEWRSLQGRDEDEAWHVDALAESPRREAAAGVGIPGSIGKGGVFARYFIGDSLSEQTQLGFAFDQTPHSLPEEATNFIPTFEDFIEEIGEPPSEEPEQKPLFEGFAPVAKTPEPEIPWTQYVRMVQLFFDQEQHTAFQEQVSKLALRYGTKNVTETVAVTMQKAAANGTN